MEKAEWLEQELYKLMGIQLDMARVSGMSDRNFRQFERMTKQTFKTGIKEFKNELLGMEDTDGDTVDIKDKKQNGNG